MASHDVYVVVGFRDHSQKIDERSYLLRTQYDDVAENFDDVVAAAALLVTALDVCTWDHISYHKIQVQLTDSGLAENIAANNQITAATRIYDTGGNMGLIEVPAWDDDAFDKGQDQRLDGAYNIAADAVALVTRNPVTGTNWNLNCVYSLSRTRKVRASRLVP